MSGTGRSPRRRRLPGQATHLVVLVAAALVPALAVGAAVVWTAVMGERTAFEEAYATPRAMALAIDTEIAGATGPPGAAGPADARRAGPAHRAGRILADALVTPGLLSPVSKNDAAGGIGAGSWL